mmetsp:Transcript_6907/g.13017  ORF Transcript_6907/g.13017 Transcript_6907/m.13017 type:complete len:1038 (+) Transcript_6907:129-3242(+)
MKRQFNSVWDLVADQGSLMKRSTTGDNNHHRDEILEDERPTGNYDETEIEVEENIHEQEAEMNVISTDDDADSSDEDTLLTDDDDDDDDDNDDDGHHEHHIQGPVPLYSILEYMKCSRDIDSISILSHSVFDLIHTMESKSVVKISNMVGDVPTTSSRHCVKQKLRKRDGRIQIKKTPLHHYQNICLGTLTANNIRFHLVMYSLQHEGSGKTKHYRPLTTNKRLVIVGSLNLARMLQCQRAKRIKKAWDQFCRNDLPSLGEIPIDVETINDILNVLITEEDQQHPQGVRHSQHWVSGGEMFYLKNPQTCASEVSSTRDHAMDFFHRFEAGLMLLSFGILHCTDIWNWCFTLADKNIMKNVGSNITCSKYSVTEDAKNLVKYKMFGLTAAGVKNDFPKYRPYQYCEDDSAACASQQFTDWLHQAGMRNMENVHACFDRGFAFDEHGVTVTVDDGLNFDSNKKKIMLLPSLNATIHDYEFFGEIGGVDSNSRCHDDEDFENDESDGHDNCSSDDDNHDDDNNTIYSVNDGNNNDYISDIEDDQDDGEGNIIEDSPTNHHNIVNDSMGSQRTTHDLLASRMLAPSTLNKYPILLNPLAASFHTGKIICSLSHDSTGISKFELMGKGDSTGVHHGDTVGYQAYATSVKNTKGASMLKNISRVGLLEKASFGLLHSSMESDEKEFRDLMDTCLRELENLDFSKNALSDAFSRSFCFRLECFRCFRQLHQNEDFDAMHNYSYNVLDIPVFLCHKEKILRNYFQTLRYAKDTITRIFTLDKGDHPISYNPRKLSPGAKTGVQFLSEILTFDVGTPNGYSRRGPITNSLIALDESMSKFGLHYPHSGVPLVSGDIPFTGLKHGLDPNHWNFIEDLNIHDEIKRIFGSMHPTNTIIASRPQIPVLDAKNVDKLRRGLGKRLFRFKTHNKDRDKCSWQLLASHFILSSTGTNVDGNVFGAEEYESFVSLFERNKSHEIGCLLEGLADIFWLCYDWEWRTDVLKNETFRNLDVSLYDWPCTVGGLSFILHGLAKPINKHKKIDSIGKN